MAWNRFTESSNRCFIYPRLSLENYSILKVKFDIRKHSNKFYIQRLYLALRSSQYGCRTTAFLACRAFVRTVFVVNTWLYNYDIWYSFSVFVFGIELEVQLSHYETHCPLPKRFLLKSLLLERRRDVANYTARWFEQAVKTPSSINTILVLTIVSYSLLHFPSSKGSNKAHSIDFERLLQSKHP